MATRAMARRRRLVPLNDAAKPPYRVPSMDEVRVVPWNGLTVASLFAGCGGSSLGYRMAGYRVGYACEWADAARLSYEANCRPGTAIDGSDIQTVSPERIMEACRVGVGELDVLDGSPPCQSFSMCGSRRLNDPRGGLFGEYVRLLRVIRPRVFVAENVPGMAAGKSLGIFRMVLQELRDSGYLVDVRLLDAQWLGVPQSRARLIFVGVRDDLETSPAYPAPLPYRYSLREAIADLSPEVVGQIIGNDASAPVFGGLDMTHPTILANSVSTSGEVVIRRPVDPASGEDLRLTPSRTKVYDGEAGAFIFRRADHDKPSPTVTTQSDDLGHPTERRKFTIPELRRVCSFPDDFTLVGRYADQWGCLGNSVPPLMMRAIAESLRDRIFAPG